MRSEHLDRRVDIYDPFALVHGKATGGRRANNASHTQKKKVMTAKEKKKRKQSVFRVYGEKAKQAKKKKTEEATKKVSDSQK